jgi:predicted PurR-regulated permease PerM
MPGFVVYLPYMRERLVEHVFFFAIFGLVGYVVWQIVAPFIGPLALAAIIATVCYPGYLRILKVIPKHNRPVGAIVSVLLIAGTIFIPLLLLSYVLFVEARAFYDTLSSGGKGLAPQVQALEQNLEALLPGFSVDITGYAQQGAGWLASHMGAIFVNDPRALHHAHCALLYVQGRTGVRPQDRAPKPPA